MLLGFKAMGGGMKNLFAPAGCYVYASKGHTNNNDMHRLGQQGRKGI